MGHCQPQSARCKLVKQTALSKPEKNFLLVSDKQSLLIHVYNIYSVLSFFCRDVSLEHFLRRRILK